MRRLYFIMRLSEEIGLSEKKNYGVRKSGGLLGGDNGNGGEFNKEEGFGEKDWEEK
jgi:hypothetical protein